VLHLKVALVLEAGMLGIWQDVTGAVDLERYVMVLDDPYSLVQDERRYPPEILARILCTRIGERAGDALEGQFYLVFEDGATLRGGFSAALEKDVP